MEKRKVVILTLDAGFGHRKAANAICEALTGAEEQNIECIIMNPLDEHLFSGMLEKTQKQYDEVSQNHRFIYQTIYDIINNYPISLFADQIITNFLIREIMHVIVDEKPDGIIVTFPIFGTAIRRILTLFNVKIPVYTVVTDHYNVHRLWFHPGSDKFFVSSDDLKKQAKKIGVPSEKVIVSGIPIDIRIAKENRSKEEIRKVLGWNSDLPIVTIVGSKRVQHLQETVLAINEAKLPCQLCIIVGGDDELFQTLSDMEWKIPIHLYNYVKNMPEFLFASDILLTKAGGLITSEGLACGLPMIIIDAISGQETGNVDYLESKEAAVSCLKTEKILDTLQKWLQKKSKTFGQYENNARKIGKPNAAITIANHMIYDMETMTVNYDRVNMWKKLQNPFEWPVYW